MPTVHMEYTFTSEAEAHARRREFIAAGRPVSLVAFDGSREMYVFDVYSPAR